MGIAPGVAADAPELKAGVAAGGVGRTGSGAAGVLPGWLGFHIENLLFLSADPFPLRRGLSAVAVVAPIEDEIPACGTALASALNSRYYFVNLRVLWSSLKLLLESYPQSGRFV